ncbi:MAG: Na-K-Cl cotransporter, partial [Myxococcota bacterium]
MPERTTSSKRITESAQGNRFGYFGGVFTPSILTILGVIMYLRLGQVVGQAGLWVALAIIIVAHLISIATGLSVSSIATNRTVRAGGAYYMISRSLGASTGAAIGIPLFFAQAISVTFYIVGFTESMQKIYPNVNVQLLGTAVLILITFVSLKSADLALRAQYVIMAAIVL